MGFHFSLERQAFYRSEQVALDLPVLFSIAATGLGAVLQTSAYALTVLKLFGGINLLWLAYQCARSAAQADDALISAKVKSHSFKNGLLLNLSNPKAVFAWMAVLALGLTEGSDTSHVIAATGAYASPTWRCRAQRSHREINNG